MNDSDKLQEIQSKINNVKGAIAELDLSKKKLKKELLSLQREEVNLRDKQLDLFKG